MNNMTQIQRISRRFRLFFTGLIICIPIADLIYWMAFNHLPNEANFIWRGEISGHLTFITRVLSFVVSLLPISVAMFGTYTLIKLFKLYENAIVFSAENVKHYRTLGFATIIWVMAEFVYVPIASLVISFNEPPGERFISIGLELMDLTTLIIGGIIVLISWVMDEGRRLEDEQAHTI